MLYENFESDINSTISHRFNKQQIEAMATYISRKSLILIQELIEFIFMGHLLVFSESIRVHQELAKPPQFWDLFP